MQAAGSEETCDEMMLAPDPDDSEMCQRLSQLYPYVDQQKTPLPRFWSVQDKCNWLLISNDSLRVTYSGEGKNPKDAGAVRADHAIPVTCGVFYFEVLVVSSESDCCIGIGLCEKNVDLNRLPGWDKCSYGYHGDDGNFFCSSGSGSAYGPTFSSNDTVGCGINLVSKSIFYTKNGANLGTAITNLSNVVDLYPMIGLQKHGEILETNFGQKPFKYNIEHDIQEAMAYTYECIYSVELPQAKSSWMNQAISGWLAHEGYSRALTAFTKATQHKCSSTTASGEGESIESMDNRRALYKLVMEGNVGEAIERIDKLYPSLLTRNKQLALMLKCQHFVEIFIQLTEGGANTSSVGSSSTSGTTCPSSSHFTSKETPVLSSFSGIKSYAQVFTRNGNSFTLTSDGSSVEPTVGEGPFKRADVQVAEWPRRTWSRLAPAVTPHARHPHTQPQSSASNGNSLVVSGEEPMEQDGCIDPISLLSSNGNAHESNGVSTSRSNGSTAESNGASHAHASATTIVAEQLEECVSECSQEGEEGQGYTKTELAPFERMQCLLEFGKAVNALSMQITHPPHTLLTRMHDAFALICQLCPRQSPMGYLMEPAMREQAATAMNSAIRELLGFPATSLLDRHLHTAREMRHELALVQVGAAVFADIDTMLLSDKLLFR